jgi:hypothetical protein
MKNRALLSVLALCVLAAGCDSQKAAEPPKPKTAAAVIPLPPAAPTAPAASANQDAQPVQVAQSGTPKQAETMALKPACKQGNNCTVELTVTGTTAQNCKITKDRPKLHVARGQPETVHWKINASGAANWDFDTNGVDFSGNSAFTCSANGAGKYKCGDKNSETTHTPHHYTIKLKAGNQTCTNDPMIVNGADNQNQEP